MFCNLVRCALTLPWNLDTTSSSSRLASSLRWDEHFVAAAQPVGGTKVLVADVPIPVPCVPRCPHGPLMGAAPANSACKVFNGQGKAGL